MDPSRLAILLTDLVPHLRPGGTLVVALCLLERSPGGHGFVDQVADGTGEGLPDEGSDTDALAFAAEIRCGG